MNEIHHAGERGGARGSRAFRPPQPTGGRDQRKASQLRRLFIGALALLASAGRVTPALAATGAGALARPAGSKPCTGGILNSQYWKVQAGDTITVQITGAKDAKPSSGTTVPVLIQSDLSLLGNVTVPGTLIGTPGTTRATVTFTWPYSMGPSCGTSHISYWGGPAAGFIYTNSALINGSKTTPAGWAIVDPACNLVRTNPQTGRCYPPLSSVQCPLQQGLVDCASGTSKYESFGFSPGGIVGGQPPYTVTASATNGVTLAPAGGYTGITLSSDDLGFSGTFPAGQTTVTITVTDAVGASVQCSFGVTIDHPTVTVANAMVCAGSSTTLTAQPAGGSGPYRFSWAGPGGFTATGQTISVSVAGQYTVTVTDSNGCKGQGSGTLTVNQPPVASISGLTNVSCNGGSDGSATVMVTGGTSPYTVTDGTTTQTSVGPFTFSNLAAKSYTYTVTDANNCTGSTSVTITQPTAPLTVSIGGLTNVCVGSNESATAAASGGTAPYSYSWDTTPVQTSATATGLSAGNTYTVTATDANHCTATATVMVPAPMDMRLDTLPIADCYGGNTYVYVHVNGGTPPFTFTDGTSSQTRTSAPSDIQYTETAGTYTFTVTDANGCMVSKSVTISQPPPFTVGITGHTNVSAYGGSDGSATAAASGAASGSVGVSYSWTGPNSFTVSGPTANNLSAGNYTVTATDYCGNQATAMVTITEPPPPP
jgi:hypothetical protein